MAIGITGAVFASFMWGMKPAIGADIIIGNGASAGVHYNIGRAICRQVKRAVNGVSCEAHRIDGKDAAEPLAVLSDLRNAALEVGIVSSDWQFHAVKGSGPFKFLDFKFDNLRALFSLYGESFTVIARRDSGIDSLDDLVGKRINIGEPGSQQREMMRMVMQAKGWTRRTFQYVDELPELEQTLALCHNRVQAIVTTVAHPNPAVARAIELCDAKIIEISNAEVEKLIAADQYLLATVIPSGLYTDMVKSVKSFGVRVSALSSSDMGEDLIYTIVKSIFDDLNNFKRLHRALGNLAPDRMAVDGLTAPIHSGALRYYREQGMM